MGVKAVFESLGSLIPTQLKAAGKFVIPGITMIKLKKKPATKAGKRIAFGKEVSLEQSSGRGIRSGLWGSPATCASDGCSRRYSGLWFSGGGANPGVWASPHARRARPA